MIDEIRTTPRRMRNRTRSNIFTGLVIITLGLALLADRMGVMSFHTFTRQWPLLLIIMGVFKLWDRGWLSLGGQALLLTGLFFELKRLGYEPPLHQWWPLLVVWAGIVITLRALSPKSASAECPHE